MLFILTTTNGSCAFRSAQKFATIVYGPSNCEFRITVVHDPIKEAPEINHLDSYDTRSEKYPVSKSLYML